jgi:hypothetical protein
MILVVSCCTFVHHHRLIHEEKIKHKRVNVDVNLDFLEWLSIVACEI